MANRDRLPPRGPAGRTAWAGPPFAGWTAVPVPYAGTAGGWIGIDKEGLNS